MKNYVIEKVSIEDFDDIEVIEFKTFKDPISKDVYIKDMLDNPYSYYYKLVFEDQLIGYFGLWVIFEDIQITTIAVDSEYQGSGFSKLMIEFIIDLVKSQNAENITLEVRKSNERAINLYQKYQFYKVAVRKNYYEDGEDAYLMKLDL
ncbi:MAG: rimI [Haloplasmataceae bacterium]|nr:rimI [Haloplasmataceae bacterium]